MGFVLFWPNQFGQFYKAPVSGPIQGQIIHSHQQPPLSAAGSQQLPSSAACHHSPAITPATFLATKKKKKKIHFFCPKLNPNLEIEKYVKIFYIILYLLSGFYSLPLHTPRFFCFSLSFFFSLFHIFL